MELMRGVGRMSPPERELEPSRRVEPSTAIAGPGGMGDGLPYHRPLY